MVCNLHFPMGTSEFRIWNRRALQKRTPYQFPGRTKNSSCMTSRTPRLHNNMQGVPHPTRSGYGEASVKSVTGLKLGMVKILSVKVFLWLHVMFYT